MASNLEMMALETDKADLSAIIELRFGEIPKSVRARIESVNKREILERMIIVAANATTFETLMEELFEEQESFRIVGEQFNPAL